MMAQYREKLDVKIPPRKRMENIQIGDPRVTRITWNGKIVKIEGDNRKFRSIFEIVEISIAFSSIVADGDWNKTSVFD
ncbi:hypothetical protein ACT4UL_04330 [Bacillus sp. HC-TM]